MKIQDLSYTSQRKLVSDNCNKQMYDAIEHETDYILSFLKRDTIEHEPDYISPFLKAQTIMRNLGWTDEEISSSIKDTCKLGFKAYEITYSKDQTTIIGLNELDAGELVPNWSRKLGHFWLLLPVVNQFQRIMSHRKVLYLSNRNFFENILTLLHNQDI